MICIVKRTEENKNLCSRKSNPVRKKGVLNHEKLYENNVRELLYEQSGCNAACRERRCTCRNAEKEFLHTVKRIPQGILRRAAQMGYARKETAGRLV